MRRPVLRHRLAWYLDDAVIASLWYLDVRRHSKRPLPPPTTEFRRLGKKRVYALWPTLQQPVYYGLASLPASAMKRRRAYLQS